MATTATASTTTPSSTSTTSRGTRVGYARVSTREQNPDAQHDALTADGCTKVFTDHASGTLAHRPALAEALGYLRPGDTLVVTKLDRLGPVLAIFPTCSSPWSDGPTP